MNNWKKAAEKERSDRYWAENPSGKWVTENYGGTRGTSLVLPEQAPISRDEAINNVLEDDTLSPKEKQEQIDHIFIYGDVVNRDMGRLKTASRLHRERTIDRDRAKGYFPIAPPKRRTYKGGGKIMPGGLSNLKKSININGQPHSLAWINPGEASALRAMGGSGKPGPMGIPSYQETDPDEYDYSDFSDYMDFGGADIMGGTTSLDALHGGLADRFTSPEARLPFTVNYEDLDSPDSPVLGLNFH